MTYYFDKISATASSLSFFLMIFAFLVPIFVDTFAMLTGSLFKGKKLCPNLSPKKTFSGAIGGVVWGVLCSVVIFFIFSSIDKFRIIFEQVNITWWKMLIVGLVSSIVCQAGDLFESFLKRKADVKDSGDILPGHGGVLDRLDSHFANIIVVLIFTLIILL